MKDFELYNVSRDELIGALKGARAEVAKGWCKNALERGGSVCAIGAIARAVHGSAQASVSEHDVSQAAWSIVKDHVPGGIPLSYYNNAETTTQQDVLDLFDKALADLGGLA